jgi:hypothetical protein
MDEIEEKYKTYLDQLQGRNRRSKLYEVLTQFLLDPNMSPQNDNDVLFLNSKLGGYNEIISGYV